MKEMLYAHLDKKGLFSGETPSYLDEMVRSVTGELPYKMKLSIAVSELILYSSQFRRNIRLRDKTQVPINGITFVLSGSGTSKDRTANGMRKCFTQGYAHIDTYRKDRAVKRAIKAAKKAGEKTPDHEATYSKYYVLRPLFSSLGTQEGMISNMNDLEEDGIGAAHIYSGEFGSELQTNPNITDNIRLWSEMYDLGKKEVKVVKGADSQSKPITCLPANALFIGSHDNILYDDTVKKKFKMEFTTKLARRAFFNFNPEEEPKIEYSSFEEMAADEIAIEDTAIKYKEELDKLSLEIAHFHLGLTPNLDITVSDEAYELFIGYKRYNEEVADSMSKLFPITQLVRKHAQWRALKLAGALAVYEMGHEITSQHYIHAASFVEMLDQDMMAFEDELRKEKYEQFVDYMHYMAEDGKAMITSHNLRKMGYISTKGNASTAIRELVQLSGSYDQEGIYTVVNDGVHYEAIERTDITSASFMPITYLKPITSDMPKEEVKRIKAHAASQVGSGVYDYTATTFEKLGDLLALDLAFSPFEYKDGIRDKDGIISSTKWLCLDIDTSKITDEEAHAMLQDFNHHIARTSDPENPFKFRVIVELDAPVDIPDKIWKYFIQSIGEFLSLKVDLLAKSQLYFGFAGRKVLSVTGKNVIEAKEHIMMANASDAGQKPDLSTLPAKEKARLLGNPHETFFYAYEAGQGSRSRDLIRAAYHAKDLGLPTGDILELMRDINDYWVIPLESDRFEKTIIAQIERW